MTAAGKVGLAVVESPAGALPALEVSGPPWGKDQRIAAALAWGALGRRAR